MEELKNWLIYQINEPTELHNESTLLWSKGFRKACIIVLEIIERIENQNEGNKWKINY